MITRRNVPPPVPNYTAVITCFNRAEATIEFFHSPASTGLKITECVNRIIDSDIENYDWDKIPSQIMSVKYKRHNHKKWMEVVSTKPFDPNFEPPTIADYIRKNRIMRQALEDIAMWRLPETGEFWDKEKTQPVSYETKYGSGVARNYIRGIASNALKTN